MKKFIKKIKSNKFLYILSVLIVGVFFILIARVTYAFLAPIINNAQTNIVIKGDTVDEFKLKVGNPLKLDATPTTLKENGTNYTTSTTATASLKANSTKNTATYNYYLYFQIENNTFTYTNGTTPEIILTITNPNGEEVTSIDGLTYGTFNGVSGFDVTTQNGLFNIANNYSITSNSSTTFTNQVWNITLTYLNLPIDQSSNFGKSMGVNVYLQKEKMTTLADYVKSLYTGTQGENGIYFHDGTIKSKTEFTTITYDDIGDEVTITHPAGTVLDAGDNSYRYAGASDQVNNYVCFGSTTTPCPDDNLYRIIGVFGDKVKLIKSDYATSTLLGADGDYSKMYTANGWDNSNYKGNNLANIVTYTWNYKNNTTINSGNGSNTWSTSLLNKTNLNKNFITNIGADWAAKIAETTWKVGGNTSENIGDQPANTAYQNEVVSPVTTNTTDGATEYRAKVGLMYASDYGFAASPSAWTAKLTTYNGETIKNVNWMYMGLYEWTISRDAGDASFVLNVNDTGHMNILSAPDALAVRPVFYLLSSVNYASGSGSATDPILVI